MFALLDAREQEPDAPDAVELAARSEVTFEHVDFSYVPDRKLLQDICIDAKPGTRFALVGPTGCGKTTLINLLLRFYDIDAGRIMVDGKASRDYTRSSLRRAFGMVLQDTWLFEGTVADNIAYGCPGATREQVIEAAERAHAHKFIVQLPGGYDTVIGEDGGTFSQVKSSCCASRASCSPIRRFCCWTRQRRASIRVLSCRCRRHSTSSWLAARALSWHTACRRFATPIASW